VVLKKRLVHIIAVNESMPVWSEKYKHAHTPPKAKTPLRIAAAKTKMPIAFILTSPRICGVYDCLASTRDDAASPAFNSFVMY